MPIVSGLRRRGRGGPRRGHEGFLRPGRDRPLYRPGGAPGQRIRVGSLIARSKVLNTIRVFADMAEDGGGARRDAFVDLHAVQGGWSQDPPGNPPKWPRLAGTRRSPPAPALKTRDVVSDGVYLIMGADETALTSAQRLADILTVTVLLAPGSDPGLGDETDFDIVYGRVVAATGALAISS